jgi:hypothetical protein
MSRLKLLAWLTVFTACLSGGRPGYSQVVTGPAGQITTPQSGEYSRKRPALRPGEFMVGDMILRHDQMLYPDSSGPRSLLQIPTYEARLWEFGVIPVAFASTITASQKDFFYANCELWRDAGVKCVPYAGEPTYVYVTEDEDGCWSYVGMQERGAQQLNLEYPGCWSKAIPAHELGHAFGLMHEHSRPDRNTYVTVQYQNIEAGQSDQFDIVANSIMIGPYDFGSVMHYAKNAFSANGQDTIVPRAGYESQAANMGQREGPSGNDLAAMRDVYRLPPILYRDYVLRPSVFPMSRGEALEAMYAIDTYYIAPQGLNRANGLSINGRPDFLGLAAWFFDIYINSRYAGMAPIEARYNVMANITRTDEWRAKHPGQQTGSPIAIDNMLPFDRAELLQVMELLDWFYRAPEGLQRPQGLSLNGSPDFQGIATWVVDVYMTARLLGYEPDESFLAVVYLIMQTDEWRQKH